jgi:hypothetical protein
MGAMIAPALAARHGPRLGKVIVVAGSAGGPSSVSPASNMAQLAAGVDALLFPLDTTPGNRTWLLTFLCHGQRHLCCMMHRHGQGQHNNVRLP